MCHSFCLFLYFITFIQDNHPITFIQYIRRGLSPSLHRSVAQWERPPCGAEPRIELGPALQQADALPTGPRRTITVPRRTITGPRRTITRVATKISRNEIPRYFVLFLFRIFAKIFPKFSRKYEIKITRNSAEFRFAKFSWPPYVGLSQ